MDLMIDTSCKENKYYGRQEAKSEALAYPTKIHLVFQPEKKTKKQNHSDIYKPNPNRISSTSLF